MIGIVGYGMVGKAVDYGFPNVSKIICDPEYRDTSLEDVCSCNPEAIFVCVPTPTDNTNYKILKDVLNQIIKFGYKGLIVVKSTILPHELEGYDIIYNPEFLSRRTSNEDFVNPPMLILGGNKAKEVLYLYQKYSIVKTDNIFLTDIQTASLAKYTMNSFYALKITFMNSIYDISKEMNVDYTELSKILSKHPWIGSYHLEVPGHDGQRGFGGPCLPKDTKALAKKFNMKLLNTALKLNEQYRQ
jgi:nucleotide sugar dehydrogenase